MTRVIRWCWSSWQRSRPTSTPTTWSSRSYPLIYNRIPVPFSPASSAHRRPDTFLSATSPCGPSAQVSQPHQVHAPCTLLARPVVTRTGTAEQAQEVHADIRSWLATIVSPAAAAQTRVIYGGSVTSANCAALSAQVRAAACVPKACFCNVLLSRTSTVFSSAARR